MPKEVDVKVVSEADMNQAAAVLWWKTVENTIEDLPIMSQIPYWELNNHENV